MRPIARQVRVAWLGTLVLKPSLRDLALVALGAVDGEDLRALLSALRGMCRSAAVDEITRNQVEYVIESIEREQGYDS